MRRLVVALLLLVLPLACGGRGAKKQPGERQVILQTEADDERVGRDVAAQVRAQMGMVGRPDLDQYVETIGRRLLRYAPRRGFDYQFDIVDQDAPNAFALPGGHIFVSRGLLTLANSEDELANVIGHEIIHVAARHAAARQALQRALPGGPFQFHSMGELAAYGRDQEREADRLGQGLSALAGYSPEGMVTFMRDLEYMERLQLGMSRLPSFFDTHPVTSERVATAAARARVIRWERVEPIAGDRNGYLRRVEGLIIGDSAKAGVIQGSRFYHPDLGFTMRFPDGWQVINTPEAVGAISPRRDAQVFLEHQGLGRDPRLSGQEYIAEVESKGFRLKEFTEVKVGGFDAFRAEGTALLGGGRSLRISLTWVAMNSSIYRITGAAISDRYMPAFISVARSFREITPAQRASVHENHLKIVVAHEGETLAQLSKRTGNDWNVQQTAIMNDIFANAKLRAGQHVKVSIPVPYGKIAAR